MSNRAIVGSIALSIILGMAIAGAFTWLMATDQPEGERAERASTEGGR